LKAIELKPDHADAYMNLGGILKEQGELDQARAATLKAIELKPNDLRKSTTAKLFFSDLHEDIDHINRERESYVNGIKEISRTPLQWERIDQSCSTDMFWVAYHNKTDDKKILESLGECLQSVCKNNANDETIPPERISAAGIPRVGICSDFLRSHTIGKLYSGIIRSLKQKGFHLTILRGPDAKTDEASICIDSLADASIRLPQSLATARELVLRQELDLLLYPDIGMSPYTYMLALERLARIQATSWGHPNTTGLNTVDYFISSDLIEPADGQTKYTEQLIKLAKLPCVYERPQTKETSSSRDRFRLPSNNCLIGIPQSLFKFHPDYDNVLEQIISRLPNARYVLIEGQNKPQTDRLKARWGKKAPTTLENTIFLPRMSQADYLCLLETVDLLLDPIYFGSGNTFYESMALGTPLVTMPGDYMRGRIVAGGYKQMKLENPPIAMDIQDYIELTVKLAQDTELRSLMKQEIRSAAQKHLFNDQEAADEIIEFIQAAVDENRKTGGLLPVDWQPSRKRSL